MHPRDLDGQLDMDTLRKLERSGFPVLTVLRPFYKKLATAQFTVHTSPECLEDKCMYEWMRRLNWPTTWRAVLVLLMELDRTELSQQIEQRLRG